MAMSHELFRFLVLTSFEPLRLMLLTLQLTLLLSAFRFGELRPLLLNGRAGRHRWRAAHYENRSKTQSSQTGSAHHSKLLIASSISDSSPLLSEPDAPRPKRRQPRRPAWLNGSRKVIGAM